MYSWMLQYQNQAGNPSINHFAKNYHFLLIRLQVLLFSEVLDFQPQTGNMNLRILNASGMLVYSMGFQKQAPHWEQHLSLFNLSSGHVYFAGGRR